MFRERRGVAKSLQSHSHHTHCFTAFHSIPLLPSLCLPPYTIRMLCCVLCVVHSSFLGRITVWRVFYIMIFKSPVQFFLSMTRLKLTYVQHTYDVRMPIFTSAAYVQLKSQQIIRDILVTSRLFQICLSQVAPLHPRGSLVALPLLLNIMTFQRFFKKAVLHVHTRTTFLNFSFSFKKV